VSSLDSLLGQLQNEKALRAWSLIITFFGDAIVSRGGNVSAKTVQAVLSRTGIGAGTIRTAFSRLASDDWVVRQKIGRESFYALSDSGYIPFKQAATRIYAPVGNIAKPSEPHWLVAIKEPGGKVLKTAQSNALDLGIQVTSNCWLFNAADEQQIEQLEKADILLLSGECKQLPSWVSSKVLPKGCERDYLQLKKQFSIFNRKNKLSPLDSMVVRCLLIHQWRRVLLRDPMLPEELLPNDWPEQSCREFVADLYHRLLPKSEVWLEEHATCATGSLSMSNVNISQRFTPDYQLLNTE